MQSYVSFRCSACDVKLKASVKLVGRARACPSCRENIVLQPVAPAPAEPLLVFDEDVEPAGFPAQPRRRFWV